MRSTLPSSILLDRRRIDLDWQTCWRNTTKAVPFSSSHTCWRSPLDFCPPRHNRKGPPVRRSHLFRHRRTRRNSSSKVSKYWSVCCLNNFDINVKNVFAHWKQRLVFLSSAEWVQRTWLLTLGSLRSFARPSAFNESYWEMKSKSSLEIICPWKYEGHFGFWRITSCACFCRWLMAPVTNGRKKNRSSREKTSAMDILLDSRSSGKWWLVLNWLKSSLRRRAMTSCSLVAWAIAVLRRENRTKKKVTVHDKETDYSARR